MKHVSIQFLAFLYLPYTPPYPSTSLRAGKGGEWSKEQESLMTACRLHTKR